jgi:Tol biopolymer transport system component
MSANGRVVVFVATHVAAPPINSTSTAPERVSDVFRYDLRSHVLSLVSRNSSGRGGNANSGYPSLTADGRYITFSSAASDLVPGDSNNGPDAFVYDLKKRKMRRLTIRVDGKEIPANATRGDTPSTVRPVEISPDGQWVAFLSCGEVIPGRGSGSGVGCPLYVRRLSGGPILAVSVSPDGSLVDGGIGPTVVGSPASLEPTHGVVQPRFSGDSRQLAFTSLAALDPSDTHEGVDVYVRELTTGQLKWATKGLDPASAHSFREPTLDKTGRFLAVSGYPHAGRKETSSFAYDLTGTQTVAQLVDLAAGAGGSLAGDRHARPASNAVLSSLRPLATFVLRADAEHLTFEWQLCQQATPTGSTTTLLSVPMGAHPYSSAPTSLDTSADGNTIAFTTTASLVPADQDDREDLPNSTSSSAAAAHAADLYVLTRQ